MFFGGDPFEHFAHAGGMPGGGRRGPPRDVDTTKLYETLGVSSMQLSLGMYVCIMNEHGLKQCQ